MNLVLPCQVWYVLAFTNPGFTMAIRTEKLAFLPTQWRFYVPPGQTEPVLIAQQAPAEQPQSQQMGPRQQQETTAYNPTN